MVWLVVALGVEWLYVDLEGGYCLFLESLIVSVSASLFQFSLKELANIADKHDYGGRVLIY